LTVNEILSSIEDPSEVSMFDGWRALRFLEACWYHVYNKKFCIGKSII